MVLLKTKRKQDLLQKENSRPHMCISLIHINRSSDLHLLCTYIARKLGSRFCCIWCTDNFYIHIQGQKVSPNTETTSNLKFSRDTPKYDYVAEISPYTCSKKFKCSSLMRTPYSAERGHLGATGTSKRARSEQK